MNYLKVLAVALCLALAGCSKKASVSTADLEANALQHLNTELKSQGITATKVDLVQDDATHWKGFATLSNGKTSPVNVTHDPQNDKYLTTF